MQLASRRVYSGRVVHLDVDTVRFPDGSTGELELVRHPGAAAVVPCASGPTGADPVILMLRQFRYAAAGPLWARRELLEEAGVSAQHVEPLTSIWTTPGFTDEVIHLFLATGLTAGRAAPERDEFIEVVPRPLSQVLAGIRDGEIRDAKSIVAILYMAGFKLGL